MPYIKRDRRVELEAEARYYSAPETPGELNYCLTVVCLDYLRQPMGGMTTSYEKLNEVVGALECAKLEFYRRMVSPHEDGAIKRNGDVYPKVGK
jgi:hypothetical protein